MGMPSLSICIATYNRAAFIGETLESIIPQLTDEVELLIVDGASTDNTREIVEGYSLKNDKVRYIRLLKKGGVDQDYDKAVSMARGKMCWLFTDDDLIEEGGVRAILSEIKKGYNLIIVNAKVMNKDFKKVLSGKLLSIESNEIYRKTELDFFFNRNISFMSFIGCVVVNRELWLNREKERYFGTQFIHIGVIFQSPIQSDILVIAKPYINIRYGNAQWAKDFFEIWTQKWPKLLSSFNCISQDIREQYLLKEPWKKVKMILLFRAKGAYTLKEYKKWYALGNTPFWGKVLLWIIALIPYFVINKCILLYFKIFSKKELLTIYDLENRLYIS